MRRRQFITLLGGAAAAWPLVVRAQQVEQMRHIGVIFGGPASDSDIQARLAAFRQVLQQLGWTEGRNVRTESRWGAGNADNTRKYAAELAALTPDVILANGDVAAAQQLQATRTVPIVFVIVPDPVGAGLVNNLSRSRSLRRLKKTSSAFRRDSLAFRQLSHAPMQRNKLKTLTF